MSARNKTFVFDRFDVEEVDQVYPDAEGEYVLAQDAIDRDESLKAQIRVLEVQLKDAKAKLT